VRRRFGIKPNVKGVVITSVDANSSAAEKRLVPGTVVVSVQQQPVNTAAELQDRIEKLRKEGKKNAVLLVANPNGDTTFVALNLD
jgi:serine protease Do